MSTKSKITWLIILAVGVVLIAWYYKSRPHYDNITSPRPVKGNVEATIILEEFSDFQCPACRAAAPTARSLLENWGDKIAFHYRHFPLLSIHANAFAAALASECANDQKKFWAYHDLLFDNQDNLSQGNLIKLAERVGLEKASFSACLKSRAKSAVVRADMEEGERRGVNATPSFFLNGQYIPNWQTLPDLIKSQVDKTATTTAE